MRDQGDLDSQNLLWCEFCRRYRIGAWLEFAHRTLLSAACVSTALNEPMRLAAERTGLLASTGRFQWGIGPARGDMRHERHRFTTQPRNRCRRKCASPALADLHRSLRLRRGAAMAIWPDPSHGGLRPHLHLLGHWCTLYWRLAALPMAHDRDRPRSRCGSPGGAQD